MISHLQKLFTDGSWWDRTFDVFLVLVVLLMFLLWIWLICEILTRNDLSALQKIVWICTIIFGSLYGIFVYAICSRPRGFR